MKYRVVEKFVSINGEGRLAGQLAVFIRFAGCNLSCGYCDTKWANEENVKYEQMSENEIYDFIKKTDIINVTLTGGEPLIQEGIEELLTLLAADKQLNAEVETNGSIDILRFLEITKGRVAFTLDYKLYGSGMENKMEHNNFTYLRADDTVKFVVGDIRDLNTAKYIIEKYELAKKCSVHLSPVFGKIEMSAIVEYMKQNKMNFVRLQPQLHKIIWHAETRGV